MKSHTLFQYSIRSLFVYDPSNGRQQMIPEGPHTCIKNGRFEQGDAILDCITKR